jgi:hypothetical protein
VIDAILRNEAEVAKSSMVLKNPSTATGPRVNCRFFQQHLTFVRQAAKRRECFGAISGGIKVQGWGAIAAVIES